MSRIAATLFAALLIGLGLLAPSASAATSARTQSVASHAYHRPTQVAATRIVSERRPPITTYDHTASPLGVDRWSYGASTCSGEPRHRAATTYYAERAALVQVARASTTSGGRVVLPNQDSPSLERSGVAANTAAKACSFAGSTTVLMADGTRKAIEDVEVGDEVIATDPETGEQVAKRVEHVFVHDDTVIDLVVDGEVITTTADHPFWSVTDQRFERADELSPGEQVVLAADGGVITVSGLQIGTDREAVAYNLSVEGIHTYHVGRAGILVHNESTCDVRGLWQITKEGTAATKQGPFGTVWKSKSDGLWWSKDTAGHGGSAWKVYEESSRGLIWRADANQYGDFIVGKHKSDIGTFIPWKDLH